MKMMECQRSVASNVRENTGRLSSFCVRNRSRVATSVQLKEAEFLPGSISYALKTGSIDKLARGVHCFTDVFDDEFAAVSYR